MWIKFPFPGEVPGEGEWFKVTTPYTRFLFNKYRKSGLYPTRTGAKKPNE